MAKNNKTKQAIPSIVRITLVNDNPARQDEYKQKFILPLIEGMLKQTMFTKAKA